MNRSAPITLRYGSLLLGLLFCVLPLPSGMNEARPYLLAMTLIYWALEAPEQTGLATAFIAGLLADIVSGTLLGEQALRLSVMIFLVMRFRARLRFFPLWQQALAVFSLLLNDRVLALLIHLMAGHPPLPWYAWLSPLIGMAAWPWWFLLLDALRLQARDRERHRD